MADQVNVNHAFVSAKADSSDSSIVSASEWNDELLLSGGQDGQSLVRDSSKPTGAKWGQATTVRASTIANYVGTTPTPAFGGVSVSLQDNAPILVIPTLGCTIVSGAVFTMRLRRNGVQLVSFVLNADGTHQTVIFVDIGGIIGVNTYDIISESQGAVNFTAYSGNLTLVVLGSFI